MLKKAKSAIKMYKNIVNSFIGERFLNSFTEGLNNKIKVIKRVAFGYKNFEFLRLRKEYCIL